MRHSVKKKKRRGGDAALRSVRGSFPVSHGGQKGQRTKILHSSVTVNCSPVWCKRIWKSHVFLSQLISFLFFFFLTMRLCVGVSVYTVYICIYEYCKCCFYVFLNGRPARESEAVRVGPRDAFFFCKASDDLGPGFHKMCWTFLFCFVLL